MLFFLLLWTGCFVGVCVRVFFLFVFFEEQVGRLLVTGEEC